MEIARYQQPSKTGQWFRMADHSVFIDLRIDDTE